MANVLVDGAAVGDVSTVTAMLTYGGRWLLELTESEWRVARSSAAASRLDAHFTKTYAKLKVSQYYAGGRRTLPSTVATSNPPLP